MDEGLFFPRVAGGIGHPQTKKKKKKKNVDLTRYAKISSRWITHLKVKCKTLKLLGKMGENLQDLGLGREFLVLTLKA